MRKVPILALILSLAAPSFALVAPPSRADSMTAPTSQRVLDLLPSIAPKWRENWTRAGGPGGEGER